MRITRRLVIRLENQRGSLLNPLKTRLREKLGKCTIFSVANGIIITLADTSDIALDVADYAAVADCTKDNNYCRKKLSDLSGNYRP